MKPPPCFTDGETKSIIRVLCDEHNIDDVLLKDLCEMLQNYSGSGRKEGIVSDITDCIDRYLERGEK